MEQRRQVSVWAYPWDVARLGIDETVRFLKESRISELSLAAQYHSGQVLSLAGGVPRWIVQETGPLVDVADGGWRQGDVHFAPRSLARDLAHALHQEKLRLRGWTVVAHDKSGWDSAVNVFGDQLPHNPCPLANQPRISAMMRDIADWGAFDQLDVEALGFLPALHGAHHDVVGLSPSPLMQFLFSLCFCPTCEANFSSQLDWAQLNAQVMTSILALIEEDMTPLNAYLDDHPLIQDFAEQRSRQLDRLLHQMVAASPIPLTPILMATNQQARLSWIQGLVANPDRTAEVIMLGYGSLDTIRRDLAWVQDQGWDLSRVVVGQSLLPAVAANLGEARARVDLLLASGVRRFCFYNLGLLTQPRLRWLQELAGVIVT